MLKQITQISAFKAGLTRPVMGIRGATKSTANANILITATRPYSLLDNAKDALDKLNKGAGKVAADGLDLAEQATKTAKAGVEEINKRASETYDSVSKSAEKLGQETAEQVEGVSQKGGEISKAAKEKVIGEAEKLEAKRRVQQHHKGYKDLQDKGSKTESEQNRPDDAV